jgi:hypothetical protein
MEEGDGAIGLLDSVEEIFEFDKDEDHEYKHHKHCCKYRHCCRPLTERVFIKAGPVINCDGTGFSIGSVYFSMELKDSQSVVLTAQAQDAAGKPTSPTFVFAVSDSTILGLVDNGDGTAVVSGVSTGATTVTATATDADGTTVSGSLDITVVASATATVTITAGTPTDTVPVA